jgi:hypothetical protein
METKNWNLWNGITFKTINYRRNFDLSVENDSIISEHDGYVSLIRMNDDLPPITIGEFGLSIWNIELAHQLNVNLTELLDYHKAECTYQELSKLSKAIIDIHRFDKIVFITNFILHPEYRKLGITEEFVEYMLRDFYAKNQPVIALVKPLQDNPIDIDFFMNHNFVEVRHTLKRLHDVEMVSAREYYSITDLFKKDDREMNEYKLFALAIKCGFKRLNESHLFILSPDNMLQRIKEKKEIMRNVEILK